MKSLVRPPLSAIATLGLVAATHAATALDTECKVCREGPSQFQQIS